MPEIKFEHGLFDPIDLTVVATALSNWMDGMIDIEYEDFASAGDTVLDESTPLYHYLSTDRFISLLGLKKIWLKQITKWPDFREGATTNTNNPRIKAIHLPIGL